MLLSAVIKIKYCGMQHGGGTWWSDQVDSSQRNGKWWARPGWAAYDHRKAGTAKKMRERADEGAMPLAIGWWGAEARVLNNIQYTGCQIAEFDIYIYIYIYIYATKTHLNPVEKY
jgi:hypothetical protein